MDIKAVKYVFITLPIPVNIDVDLPLLRVHAAPFIKMWDFPFDLMFMVQIAVLLVVSAIFLPSLGLSTDFPTPKLCFSVLLRCWAGVFTPQPAASVAIEKPPAGVTDFNEADFERAAREAHERWGHASPANLKLLLQFHGFRGE